MSQSREDIIKCPNCGAEGAFTVWESVNADIHPELKEKILNEELFVWTCPECGTKMFVAMSFIYHDMTNSLLVFFDFDEDADPCAEEEIGYVGMFSNFGEYRFRTAHGLLELKELILINNYGLDDVTIAYMKYCIKHLMYPDKFEVGDDLRFVGLCKKEGTEDILIAFLVIGEEKNKGTFKFPIGDYYEYADKVNLDPRFKVCKMVNVSEKWIEDKLKQIC